MRLHVSSLLLVTSIAGCVVNGRAVTPGFGARSSPPPPPPARHAAAPAPARGPAPVAAVARACSQPDLREDLPVDVAIPGAIEGCFEPAGGKDLYRITVGGEGMMLVTVSVERHVRGAVPFVNVFTDERVSPAGAGAISAWQVGKTKSLVILARAGQRFLVEAYTPNEPRDPGAYTIRIDETPRTDPGEPNDEPARATPLVLGPPFDTAATQRLDAQGRALHDVDHYRLVIDRPATLRLTAEAAVGDVAPRLELRDARGRRLAESRWPRHRRSEELAVALTPGTYLVVAEHRHDGRTKIIHRDRAGDISVPYRITATVE